MAIETALALRLLFHLPLRQTEGVLDSVFRLMDLALPCPDHTTLSRRHATVAIRGQINRGVVINHAALNKGLMPLPRGRLCSC